MLELRNVSPSLESCVVSAGSVYFSLSVLPLFIVTASVSISVLLLVIARSVISGSPPSLSLSLNIPREWAERRSR